jgi:hypothetical protein
MVPQKHHGPRAGHGPPGRRRRSLGQSVGHLIRRLSHDARSLAPTRKTKPPAPPCPPSLGTSDKERPAVCPLVARLGMYPPNLQYLRRWPLPGDPRRRPPPGDAGYWGLTSRPTANACADRHRTGGPPTCRGRMGGSTPGPRWRRRWSMGGELRTSGRHEKHRHTPASGHDDV